MQPLAGRTRMPMRGSTPGWPPAPTVAGRIDQIGTRNAARSARNPTPGRRDPADPAAGVARTPRFEAPETPSRVEIGAPAPRSKAARHRKRQEKMAADAQLPGASKVCGNSRNLPNLLTSERLVPPGTPEPLTPDSGEPSFRWRSVQHFNYEQEHVAVRAHGDIGQGLSLGPSSRQVPRRDPVNLAIATGIRTLRNRHTPDPSSASDSSGAAPVAAGAAAALRAART